MIDPDSGRGYRTPALKYLVHLVLLAAAYFVAAQLGHQLALLLDGLAPVWPAMGVALAGLIIGGIRLWPAILIASFASQLTAGPVPIAVAIAAGNTLAAVGGALICRRCRGVHRDLRRLSDALWYLLAALTAPLINATIGVAALHLGGLLTAPFITAWAFWWSGDAFGALLVGTLLLAWSTPSPRRLGTRARIEIGLLAIGIAALTFLVFEFEFLDPILLLPAVMWASLRFGLRGGTIAGVVVASVATWSTLVGGVTRGNSVLELQFLILTTSFIAVVLAAVVDERSHAFRELRTQSQAQSAVLEASPLAIIALDPAGIVKIWNLAAERTFGWTSAEVLGRPMPYVPAERESEYARFRERMFAGIEIRRVETQRLHKDGRLLDVELSAARLLDADDRPVGIVGVLEDVTDRKRLERERRRLSEILENTTDLVGIAQPDGVILYVNPAGHDLLGIPAGAAAVGRRISEFYSADTARLIQTAVLDAVERDGVWSGETTLRAQDGTEVPVHQVIVGHRGPNGEIEYLSTIARDMRQWRRAQTALDEQTRRVQMIVDSAVDAVVSTDEFGTIIGWDGRAEQIFGWRRHEAVGRALADVLIPEHHREAHARGMERFLQTGTRKLTGIIEITALRRDGAEFPVELAIAHAELGGRMIFSAFIRDVTERRAAADALRQSEEQLRQAQKMEAVGQLAGGIAHDFNNLLTTIMGFSDLVIDQLPSGDAVVDDVREIRRAADRASALTRQLLAFSRRQVIEPRVLDVNGVVVGVGAMLRRLIGENVALVTELDPDLGHARVDRGQLEQIIVNLAVNSRDAMPDGGTLTIATRNDSVAPEIATRHPGLEPGAYVVLSVRDVGEGMSAETLAHAFEPFFTTKEPGKGTGLGLSTVYGIVRQHAGVVLAHSRPGAGTTFDVYLPRVQNAQERERPQGAERPGGGHERILLVEDEQVLRELAQRILRRYGYEVHAAPDAAAAMIAAAAVDGPIDLLLTDVVMPGRNGPQLADDLRALRPGLRVLLMSGYTGTAIVNEGLLDPGVRYLQKPFAPDGLVRAVREALDAVGR